MALSIGELTGYLTLDDSKFDKGLKKVEADAPKQGERIGEKLGNGWVRGADGKIRDARGKFVKAGDLAAAGLSNGFERTSESRLSKMKSGLSDKAKTIGLAMGAAAGAAIAAGVAANINLGKANDKLAAQLGLTGRDARRAGRVAGGLYRDAYGDSIEGVNDAVGAVMSSIEGMSHASGRRLERVTAKALDFASAFEVDVQRAVQIAGQAVETGLAKNATQAFDLITAASQKVPSAVREDFLDAADEYGQFFAGLGYSGQQAFAMLVDASDKGMYGLDKMGDAVKEFTIRSTDMSKTSKQAYKSLGLDAHDMTNAILAGGDKAQGATQKIINGLLSMKDPSKQAQAALALFGTPLEDLNTAEIPGFLKSLKGMSGSMDDTKGASKRMGDTLNDNFATRMEGWKRSAQGFVQDALMAIVKGFEVGEGKGKGFMGAMSKLGAFIKSPLLPTVKDLGGWVKRNKDWLFALAAGAGAALLAFRAIMFVQTVTKAIKASTLATKGLNAALRANPIGIVVTVLGLLVAAFIIAYKKSDTFRAIVDKAWAGIQKAAKWAWNNVIKPIFKAWKDYLSNVLIPAIEWLWKHVIKPGFAAIGSIIKGAWNNVIKPVFKFLVDAVEGIKKAFTTTRDGIKGAWEAIKDKSKAAVLWLVDKMLWFADKTLGAAEKAFGWAPGIGDKLKKAHDKVRAFRQNVNSEMDRIKDEVVKVTLDTVTVQHAQNKNYGMLGFGGGGRSPAPRASGGGMGGGPSFRLAAPMAGVRKATDAIQERAEGRAEAIAEHLKKNMATAGASGRPGSVLPRGSYSIGMPYLGYPGHYGADYPAPVGTPVFAPWLGRVTASYDIPGSSPYNNYGYASYGRVVKIAYANGLSSLFAHLSQRLVSAGQMVRPGQQVGAVGSMGNSTGPHLHAEFSRNGSTFNPASLGLFDFGGLAKGAGLMAKGPQPERVLSPRQTEAFERAMDRGFGGLPDTLVLRVGDREFTAYVDERADGRIASNQRSAKIHAGSGRQAL